VGTIVGVPAYWAHGGRLALTLEAPSEDGFSLVDMQVLLG
jgi:hypothetical protein